MMSGRETEGLRTNQVFEALRFELLESRLLPGERLKLVELSQRFGISQTVLREALTRLSEQGLVASNPKRGFTVAQLSVADLQDLTKLRLQLEVLAFVESIKNGNLAWETAVVAAHHALERTPYITEAPQHAATWRQAHRAFHHALCAGSGSPRLEKVVSELRDGADLYRAWANALGSQTGRNVGQEHRALLDAAVGRNADLGAKLLSEHLLRTSQALISTADNGTSVPQ